MSTCYGKFSTVNKNYSRVKYSTIAPSNCSTVPMEAIVFKAEQLVVHPKG